MCSVRKSRPRCCFLYPLTLSRQCSQHHAYTLHPSAAGGLVSGALFQYPGAVMMTGLGIASAKVLQTPPFWLSCCASGALSVGVRCQHTDSKEDQIVQCSAAHLLRCWCTNEHVFMEHVSILVGRIAGAMFCWWQTHTKLSPISHSQTQTLYRHWFFLCRDRGVLSCSKKQEVDKGGTFL